MTARDDGRSRAEWITTAISLALIALLCAAILYEGYAAGSDGPATIEVEASADRAEQRAGSWYVPFAVRNTGDEAVEELVVAIELLDGEQAVAEAETTIVILGEDEELAGMAVFAEDPRPYRAEGRARSFQLPER